MTRQPEFDPREVYKYNPSGNSYEVGIALDDYHEVYNEWDFTPGKNRDMDEDLFEYIYESSIEIPLSAGFIINFYLPETRKDAAKEEKSRSGLYHYFKYAQQRGFREKKRLRKNIFQYIMLGLSFLTLAYVLQKHADNDHIMFNLLNEGFMIGGWVMLWETTTAVFFKYRDLRHKIRHLQRITNSKIEFSYVADTGGDLRM